MPYRIVDRIRKYSNQRESCRLGHSHRSKLESAVCGITYLRERAGELKILSTEVTIHLSRAKIAYIADLHCLKNGQDLFIEAKGFETPEWRLKRRLWIAYGLAPLEIWMGTYDRPFLKETIVPKQEEREV